MSDATAFDPPDEPEECDMLYRDLTPATRDTNWGRTGRDTNWGRGVR